MRKLAAVVAIAGAGLIAAPSAAQAEITQVFTETPTPIDCTVQGAPDTGVRFCTNQAGEDRSTVATFDGVPIDINVAFPPAPESGPDGPYPTVMMFHGYGGSKIGLSGMRRWLNQGYATFSMTTRGFHQSCGTAAARAAGGTACDDGYVRLMDTRYEVRDAQEFIALLVDEGLVDPNAIGASGGSYGGGMSMALAALKNRKMLPDGTLVPWESPDGTDLELAAAVPQIPWTDLAYSLVPNGGTLDYIADAPYFGHVDQVGVEKLGWVNLLYSGPVFQGTGFYADPGVDPSADLATWKFLLDQGGPYGQTERDVIEEIAAHHSSYYIDDSVEPAPMLISNGFTDDLFPTDEAVRYYNRTRTTYPGADIALTFGDFGHPRGSNLSATTNAVGAREHTWMAYYLKGEGTEPSKDVTALTQVCSGSPTTYTGSELSTLAPGEITYTSNEAKTIVANGQVLFGSDLSVNFPTPTSVNSCKTVGPGDSGGGAVYKLPAAPAGGYTLLGSPTVIADFDSPGANNQVAARLMDIAPNGDQKLIARGLWRPEVSDEPVKQVFQLHANGWKFEEGHVAKLELLPKDEPYSNVATGQTNIEVSNLELRLPVAEAPGSLGGLVDEPAEKFLPGATQLARGFDSGPPATRFVATPGAVSNDSTPTFDYMSSDVGSTYECRLDSTEEADWEPCLRDNTLDVGEGDHVFEVRAIDPDSNVDPTPISFEFTVDTTPPNTFAKVKDAKGKDVKLVFSSNEENATFECKRAGKWKPCESPRKFTHPFGKKTKISVRAIDQAGNVDPTPAKVDLKN